jgi:putative membrane protein insertion efficiency factor
MSPFAQEAQSAPTHQLCDGESSLWPRSAASPAAWLALVLIALYRKAISPILPPACRFVPTCSEYGYEAIARYGILAGGRLAIWRVLRCNPFGDSGYDPVP